MMGYTLATTLAGSNQPTNAHQAFIAAWIVITTMTRSAITSSVSASRMPRSRPWSPVLPCESLTEVFKSSMRLLKSSHLKVLMPRRLYRPPSISKG